MKPIIRSLGTHGTSGSVQVKRIVLTAWASICAACTLSMPCNAVAAEAYPNKLVRIIVPATPGGGGDVLMRPFSQKLGAAWGQSVILDYRPGGGTVLGTAIAAKSPPDGYTMALVQTSFSINATMRKALPFDPVKDFAPITQMTSQAHLVVVHPSLPVKTIRQLIALSKERPGQLNYGSSYSGSGGHLAGELFKSMAGVNMVYVPYKGGAPALSDLLGGQIDLMFSTMLNAMPHVKAGRVRALAVTTAKRMPLMLDVPTIAESGVAGYESSSWAGLLAPAGTPAAIITRLNTDIRQVLLGAETRELIARDGGEAVGGTPEEFGALIRSEIDKWSKVIKAYGIKDD
jgi:tripartite-type tricarboxylate transporter receptor subunit TctC